jgi:hypothetical protein
VERFVDGNTKSIVDLQLAVADLTTTLRERDKAARERDARRVEETTSRELRQSNINGKLIVKLAAFQLVTGAVVALVVKFL